MRTFVEHKNVKCRNFVFLKSSRLRNINFTWIDWWEVVPCCNLICHKSLLKSVAPKGYLWRTKPFPKPQLSAIHALEIEPRKSLTTLHSEIPPLIRNTNIAFVGQSINQPTKLINKLLNHSYCMFDSSHPALDTFPKALQKNKSHNTINYQIPLPLIWYRNLPQILPHGGSKASKRHVEKKWRMLLYLSSPPCALLPLRYSSRIFI